MCLRVPRTRKTRCRGWPSSCAITPAVISLGGSGTAQPQVRKTALTYGARSRPEIEKRRELPVEMNAGRSQAARERSQSLAGVDSSCTPGRILFHWARLVVCLLLRDQLPQYFVFLALPSHRFPGGSQTSGFR